MMILSGAPSLSPFRREKLLTKLRESDASIQSVCAEYVHFAEVCKPLTPAETITLEALLTYGPSQQKADKRGQLLLVAPRPGTISRGPAKRLISPIIAGYKPLFGWSEVLLIILKRQRRCQSSSLPA